MKQAKDYRVTFGYGAKDGYYIDEEDKALYETKGRWLEIGKIGYAQVCWKENGKRHRQYLHRLITQAKKGEIVDHINQNKLDNRRSNLRIVSAGQNVANSKLSKRNTSAFRNVYWQKNRGKWFVQLVINRKKHFFGYFTDKNEANSIVEDIRTQIYGNTKGVLSNG